GGSVWGIRAGACRHIGGAELRGVHHARHELNLPRSRWKLRQSRWYHSISPSCFSGIAGRFEIDGFKEGLSPGELKAPLRSLLSVFLALVFAGVSRELSVFLQHGPQLRIEHDEGFGNCEAGCVRLPLHSAAGAIEENIDAVCEAGE